MVGSACEGRARDKYGISLICTCIARSWLGFAAEALVEEARERAHLLHLRGATARGRAAALAMPQMSAIEKGKALGGAAEQAEVGGMEGVIHCRGASAAGSGCGECGEAIAIERRGQNVLGSVGSVI